MTKRLAALLLLVAGALSATPAVAGEFFGFFGRLHDTGTTNQTYAWAMEYRESLGENFAASLLYQNEGHVPNHHRDGHGAMLWARTNQFDRQLSLAAGAGLMFLYFDTTAPASGPSYNDNHGTGAILGLSATWYTESRWLLQLRTNWIATSRSVNTYTAMLGIGYQLDAAATPGPRTDVPYQLDKTTNNELTAYVGRTIVNSFASEKGISAGLEYRRGLLRYLDGTVTFLNEGDAQLVRRNGIVTELWLTRAFLDEHLTLAYGLGPYFSIDRTADDHAVDLMLSMAASYRFTPRWGTRIVWNRVATANNRDTDVMMLGLIYRF